MGDFNLPLLFLSLCLVVTGVVAPPATTSSQPFTNKEIECFALGKVLHSDGQCYTLHHKGPCRENEWLVYEHPVDSTSKLVLKCKTRQCNSGNAPIYWPEDSQCHKRIDGKTLCPYQGNQLRSDSFGLGECACERNYARLESEVLRSRSADGEWPWEGDCYPIFYRGPCPKGKIFYPKVLPGFGLVAFCVNDLCSAQNNVSTPDVSYVMRKEDRRCYKLNTEGPPCAATEMFSVHPMLHLPTCYSKTNSLFSNLSVRCGGEANIDKTTGECREEVVVLQTLPFGYEATRRKRPRRRSGR